MDQRLRYHQGTRPNSSQGTGPACNQHAAALKLICTRVQHLDAGISRPSPSASCRAPRSLAADSPTKAFSSHRQAVFTGTLAVMTGSLLCVKHPAVDVQ
jgi:hypothetical protein